MDGVKSRWRSSAVAPGRRRSHVSHTLRDPRTRGAVLVSGPTYSGTMALIVNARPEHIWPWLVQMGYQRGGLYSYDWLDRLFGFLDRPSATRILPEFQHLAVGDEIPLGRGPAWPVAVIEPR